ncbi:uncharacterized protein LOC131940055 isoform X2 [Physella acuta]|nr:uncharacterized protein LOC131940055 isoform X2 [Physella acuta]XP_059154591.1 uncharacterized protein LOC131940055 isoform X2 [Physella acuta]XP_059154592.1 uncharacterized protein LOC131940055 isoform X2 [Physella acuta]XP_059154593.1 uncharacterized protein LOC131940055 isoform X2 [Physella acuta]XP_059154594.1 uncharacterized protein LOC131940055 isoform X2 [Physella acuta]XP_059154595.1 uncharacterized protein LOC131940055 isoform X2 [Physella acuta]XP_059154596.1 uncharacterized prot
MFSDSCNMILLPNITSYCQLWLMTCQCLTTHLNSMIEPNNQQINKLFHGNINLNHGGLTLDMRYNKKICCFKKSVDKASLTQFSLQYKWRCVFVQRKSAVFVSDVGTVKHRPIYSPQLNTLEENNNLCNATEAGNKNKIKCKIIFKEEENTHTKFLHLILKHDDISSSLYWYLCDYPIFIHTVIALIAIFYVATLFYIFKKVNYKNVTLYLNIDPDTDKLLFLVRFISMKNVIGLHRKMTSVTLSVSNLKPKLIVHLDPYVYEKTVFTNTFKIVHLAKEKVQSLFEKISSPMFGFKNRLDEYACYPVFEMSRVASFRNVDFSTLPNIVYATQLAASGFYYSGEDLMVICVSCSSRVELSHFISSPAGRRYHEENCSFVEDERGNCSFVENKRENQSFVENKKEYVWISSAPTKQSGDVLEPEQGTSLLSAGLSETQTNVFGLENQLACTNSEFLKVINSELQEEDIFDVSSLTSISEEADVETPLPKIRRFMSSNSLTSSASFSSGYSSASSESSSEFEMPRKFYQLANFEAEYEISVGKFSRLTQRLLSTCKKNPDHLNFIPSNDFQLDHLPRKCQHSDVLILIKLYACLTAKITVSKTSSKRLSNDSVLKESRTTRYGTGCALDKPNESNDEPQATLQSRFKSFAKRSYRKTWSVFVETTTQLVFDNEEAKSCTVELCLDLANRSKTKCLKGEQVLHSNMPGELRSTLVCTTKDVQFIKQLQQTQQDLADILATITDTIMKCMEKYIWIISYPHGSDRCISSGEFNHVNYKLQVEEGDSSLLSVEKVHGHEDIASLKEALTYKVPTCPGSTGAPIITATRSPIGASNQMLKIDVWMHYGIENRENCGVSVMRTYLNKDSMHLPNLLSAPEVSQVLALDHSPHVMVPQIPEVQASACEPHSPHVMVPHIPEVQASAREPHTPHVMVPHIPEVQASAHEPHSPHVMVPHLPTQPTLGHRTHPVYSDHKKRLDSFVAWPANSTHTPQELADAGFYCTGHSHCVQCFYCGLVVKSWSAGDDILFQHQNKSPGCCYLQAQLCAGLTPLARQDETYAVARQISSLSHAINQPQEVTIATALIHTTISQNYTSESLIHQGENNDCHAGVDNQNFSSTQNSPQPSGKTSQDFSTNQVISSPHPSSSDNNLQQPTVLVGNKTTLLGLLERENRTLSHQTQCKVCQSSPVRDLFLPCGHLYACTDCSQHLAHCPACGTQILATVTTYFT